MQGASNTAYEGAQLVGGGGACERIKCHIFDYEMWTLLKVGGEDSKGRRVLKKTDGSLGSKGSYHQIQLQRWGWGLSEI